MQHLTHTGLNHACYHILVVPSSLGCRIISNMLQIIDNLLRLRLSSALSRLWPRDTALWPAHDCLPRFAILMRPPLSALQLSTLLRRAWLIRSLDARAHCSLL